MKRTVFFAALALPSMVKLWAKLCRRADGNDCRKCGFNSVEKEMRAITRPVEWGRGIALIPVFVAAICVFSTKAIAQHNVHGGVENPIADKDRMITRGKGVSQELLTEYQEIVNKYREMYSTGNPGENDKFYWKSDNLSEEDWIRLYVIYVQMTDNQKSEQMISFHGPPPAFNRAYPPPQRLYDLWIKDKKCKIMIDGEQVDNSALNSFNPTDFVRYFTSSLLRSGGQRDEYRVDLWTETGHKKFNEQFFEQPVSIERLLEIEPGIVFLVEKDNNKPISLQLNYGV
jgi:hypothetical protein